MSRINQLESLYRMEVPRTAIPQRTEVIPKDVLPKVSGANSGAPKLKLPEVVIVPQVAVPLPSPVVAAPVPVQEDPELLALRREMQAVRLAQSQQRVGAMPSARSPPMSPADMAIARIARRYGKTIAEVKDVVKRARSLGMKPRDLMHQIVEAEKMVPTRSKREVKPVERLVDVQHLYTKGRYHGRKDGWDRKFNGKEAEE